MTDPVPEKPTHHPSKPLAEVFHGQPVRDQYDRSFDPAQLQEGAVIVFTFYDGCPRCGLSTRTIAALQQEFLDRRQKVQIVGITTLKPENDATLTRRKYVTTGYYERGVKQFSGEKDPEKHSEAAFVQGEFLPVEDRLFHILRPVNEAAAKEIEQRMGHVTKGSEAHTAMISLYHNGQFVQHYPGLPQIPEIREKNGKQVKEWRDILPGEVDDNNLGDPNSLSSRVTTHAKELAPVVAGRIEQLAKQQKPSPTPPPKPEGLTAASLWNFGLPAVAAILVTAVSEGSGWMKLLWGLLAGGSVSVLTQWVTGKGIFAETKPAPSEDHGHAKQPEKPTHEPEKHASLNLPDYERMLENAADTKVTSLPPVPKLPKDAKAQNAIC